MLPAQHPGRAVGAARRALDHGVEIDRRPGDLRRRGNEAGLDLARSSALADDEVSQHTVAVAPVVRWDARAARPRARLVARCVVGLGRELAVLRVDHHVPAPTGVEAERELAVAITERVLELVAIAPLLDRGLGRLDSKPVEVADAAKGVDDLLVLVSELALIRKRLPRRAGAGLAPVLAADRKSICDRSSSRCSSSTT